MLFGREPYELSSDKGSGAGRVQQGSRDECSCLLRMSDAYRQYRDLKQISTRRHSIGLQNDAARKATEVDEKGNSKDTL